MFKFFVCSEIIFYVFCNYFQLNYAYRLSATFRFKIERVFWTTKNFKTIWEIWSGKPKGIDFKDDKFSLKYSRKKQRRDVNKKFPNIKMQMKLSNNIARLINNIPILLAMLGYYKYTSEILPVKLQFGA